MRIISRRWTGSRLYPSLCGRCGEPSSSWAGSSDQPRSSVSVVCVCGRKTSIIRLNWKVGTSSSGSGSGSAMTPGPQSVSLLKHRSVRRCFHSTRPWSGEWQKKLQVCQGGAAAITQRWCRCVCVCVPSHFKDCGIKIYEQTVMINQFDWFWTKSPQNNNREKTQQKRV